jgi:hypothetical protein
MFMAETNKPDAAALTATPEFQKIVAEAVAKALADSGKANLPGADEATKAFFSQMALTIAEISDQGTNRKRVSPEILARRAAAAERCEKLILAARDKGLKPEYRVVSKIYFNERLIEPYRRGPDKSVVPQEIIWTGMPNEALRPLNACAEEIYQAYRESVGSTEKLRSIKGSHGGIVAPDNRPYSITPNGLVVKGEISPKAVINAPLDYENVGDNNDPNAAEVHVLGTVAAPAKRNFADPAQAMAARTR